MKTSNKRAPLTREELVQQVKQVCEWILSQEGWTALFYGPDDEYNKQLAESKLWEMRCALEKLFETSQEQAVIDLTDHNWTVDVSDQLRIITDGIESEKRLPHGSLFSRVRIIDASNPDSLEYQQFMREKEEQLVREIVTRPPTPLKPFELALRELKEAIIL